MGREHPDVAILEPIYVEVYSSSPFGGSDNAVLCRVEPEAMYAYAPDPKRFAEDRAH